MFVLAVSFMPGQRWVSNTEAELGLGIVIDTSNRRVELRFPAAGESRVYAMDNAPLSRVQYQVGEQVSSEDGRSLTIDAVMEANGCLIYGGVDAAGLVAALPERDLYSFVQFSKPQDRLFAGQIDNNQAFQLRCETLLHSHRQQQSSVRGLLGPRVQLLPHQLYIASEVANRYAPRVLLADEVGLGKTIEAGLILHQQLISGRARRVMIVVPDSLLHQWLVEMVRRFNLLFTIIDEARCRGGEEAGSEDADCVIDAEPAETTNATGGSDLNPFESSQLILCTLSFLRDHPDRHAQAVAADWDLLIVDEAHHLRWSEQLASPAYLCIEALARKTRGLLLLTATPEQLGVDGHFARLRLLDPDRYYDLQAFIDEERKHQPVNRLVQSLLAKDVLEHFPQQQDLQQQLRTYLGDAAVVSLLQTAGSDDREDFAMAKDAVIRDLLDRHGTGRVLFRNTRASVGGFPDRQLHQYPLPAPERYVQRRAEATAEQLLAPELLLGELWIAEDPRVQWLQQWLTQHRGEKVLLICAGAATAISLEEQLRLRAGVQSAVFHEGLTLVARDRAAAYFSDDEKGCQLLVCSEIGSEGRNFQFSRHLVLFDLPLNPDLLEQRIGRLDRIGQRNTVQIHAPYYAVSAQAVLLSWYHLGLDAIEHTCPAGQSLYEYFAIDLRRCMQQAHDETALSDLLQRTRSKTAATLLALQQGRDRLLELNSFNARRADEIVGEMLKEERRRELSAYMDQVFDQFGVEQEHHSANSVVLRPGDHMLVHGFPALAEDGITATYQRDLALRREDMQYLTWEHPMVTGAMDLVLGGEFGNTAFCTVKLPPMKPGTILLEAVFTLSCTAPGALQLQRYLPQTTVRIVVDHHHADVSEKLSQARLNSLAQKVPVLNAQELVRHTRAKITTMIGQAKTLAEAKRNGILDDAVANMQASQGAELERLQALAAVNSNIRQEEIQHVKDTAGTLLRHLHEAQLRLDAMRVAMVTS